jgi:5-methylcytosine-specific restriction endonuclease McrA
MPPAKRNLGELIEYHLRRWSLLVRIRDDFVCHVCGKRCKLDSHAHHIYPKVLYGAKAYELNNGITVCAEHHRGLVHITKHSWKKWTDFFKRPLRRKKNREYNETNQHKVRRK